MRMELKRQSRPEDIIVGTDPVAIDIIQQIYSAIKDKNESDRTFLERCWVLGIEKAYKSDTKKLDPELCTKLLERIYYHLEHKNIWDADDDKLYDLFERIISLKTLRDSSIKEIFDDLEEALANVLQLDFSKKISIDYSRNEKRNIFNYIVFFFNSIIEKIETSMVSAKAVNAFLSLHPGTLLIITDNEGRLRFMNEYAVNQLGVNANEGYHGLNIKDIIKNFGNLLAAFNKHGEVKNRRAEILAVEAGRSMPVSVSMPRVIRDGNEKEEMVFVIRKEN